MGIVDLQNIFLMEVAQRAIHVQVLFGNGLHRGGHKEILLLEPQRLALVMIVLGVENFGNGLCHGLLLGGLEILPPGE